MDYVFKGEAEYSFLELVNTLEAGKEVELMPGIHFRRGEEIVSSPESPMIPDLDALPFPAHDLFKIDRYTNLQPLTDGLDPHARSFTILTSRGCPYKCTFCSKPVTGDTWRARSVENVVQEWKWLVKGLGATEIGVTDDIWNLKLPRAKELCRRLVEEGLNTVPWVTVHGMKVNHSDLELFQLMKAAGCKRVGFGVENGDEHMLRNVIRKGQTIDMVREAFANAKAAELQTMGFFIYGMPGDTEETMEKTTQLALELDPKLANFLLAAPFPGTVMYDMIQEGGEVFADNWTDFAIHEQKARFTMNDGYDPDLVLRKWREAYRRFYLYRPERVWEKMTFKENWTNLPNTVAQVKRFFIGNKDQRMLAPMCPPAATMTSTAWRSSERGCPPVLCRSAKRAGVLPYHDRTLPKLPLYWSFRTFGWPKIKPFSVVISVSFRCNSKCRTCDVWRKPNDDLSVDEWERSSPAWAVRPST